MEEQAFNVDSIIQVASDLVLIWGLKVAGALAVLVIGRLVAGGVRGSVRKLLRRLSGPNG